MSTSVLENSIADVEIHFLYFFFVKWMLRSILAICETAETDVDIRFIVFLFYFF